MTDRHRQTGRQTEILYYLQYLLVLRSKNRVFVLPLIFSPPASWKVPYTVLKPFTLTHL